MQQGLPEEVLAAFEKVERVKAMQLELPLIGGSLWRQQLAPRVFGAKDWQEQSKEKVRSESQAALPWELVSQSLQEAQLLAPSTSAHQK